MIIFPPNLPALNIAIVRRAQLDLPIVENPKGSNRSPEIDAMCRRWGVPLRSYWCALWTADVWKDAGAEVPPVLAKKDWHPAKCETWRRWALETNRFSATPIIGAAPLYGNGGHEPASHIGPCVVAIAPALLAFEGNTSLAGYSRNGELTAMKAIDTDRLIGYVSPLPL